MSTIKVYDKTGAAAGEKTVDEAQLVLDRGEQAVKDTVVAILNGMRAGTAKTKNRSEVSGSGKKPWKQKGTGRAWPSAPCPAITRRRSTRRWRRWPSPAR